MFFTLMRAERKLSTPPGMPGRFTLMSTPRIAATAARLSRHAIRPARRTSTREAEGGMRSETEIAEIALCISGDDVLDMGKAIETAGGATPVSGADSEMRP